MRIELKCGKKPRQEAKDRAARVLIVDDDPSVGAVVTHLLDSIGYESSSCISATQALIQLKDEKFDVVLTDFRMPKMNGVELAQEARKCNSMVPVILMTGYAASMEANEMELAEINRILEKPIALPNLERAIKSSLMDKSEWY
jgi:DNA-binding NtrC family response regulator